MNNGSILSDEKGTVWSLKLVFIAIVNILQEIVDGSNVIV